MYPRAAADVKRSCVSPRQFTIGTLASIINKILSYNNLLKM